MGKFLFYNFKGSSRSWGLKLFFFSAGWTILKWVSIGIFGRCLKTKFRQGKMSIFGEVSRLYSVVGWNINFGGFLRTVRISDIVHMHSNAFLPLNTNISLVRTVFNPYPWIFGTITERHFWKKFKTITGDVTVATWEINFMCR